MSDNTIRLSELSPDTRAKVLGRVNGVDLGPDSPLLGTRRKPRELEMLEQRKVIQWADHPTQRAKWPELERLFHVPNGGYRSKAVAGKMKSIGVRRGVPDLWLPVSRWSPGSGLKLPGVVLELKATDSGALTGLQRDWLDFLNGDGWIVFVSHGADEAIRSLTHYLELPRHP